MGMSIKNLFKKPAAVQTVNDQATDIQADSSPTGQLSPKKNTAKVKPPKPDQATGVSIFYGFTIRKLYIDKKWYFCLEDIMPLAKYDNPKSDLDKLNETAEFHETFEKVAKEIDGVSWVSSKAFMELWPLIRSAEHMIPGSFPDWLKSISELPPAS